MDQSLADRLSVEHTVATIVPIFASIGCVLCIPALIIHMKARNLAAMMLILGIIVPNFFNFSNALLWPTTASVNHGWDGQGPCDLEVKLYIGFATSTVGAVACIFRQLAVILDTDKATLMPSPAQRGRRLLAEAILCMVIPLLQMAAHYLVQPNRYYLLPVTGCAPSIDSNWGSIILIFVWPVIICMMAAIWGCISVYRLIKYRREFANILSSSQSKITQSRFLRLFALATTLILVYTPLSVYTLVRNLNFHHESYSWSRIHPADWSSTIPRTTGDNHSIYPFDRAIQIGTAYIAFIFFGFGQDATRLYRAVLLKFGLARFFPAPQTRTAVQIPNSVASADTPLTVYSVSWNSHGVVVSRFTRIE